MSENTPATASAIRYHDIDWLRVFATLVVFLFHAAKPFLADPWHIKDAHMSPVLEFMAGLVDVWMMPLLFFVSGMSIALSLRRRTARQFVQERLSRLLLPFLVGVFLLGPIQIYIERLHYGQFQGSFFLFLRHAYDGLYLNYGGDGNFAWMGVHLWYLAALLIYSLLLLPLFLWLSGDRMRDRLTRLAGRAARPAPLLLSALPLMLLSSLNPTGLGWRGLGAWNFPIYLAMLVYGFLAIKLVHGGAVLHRFRWLSLVAAVLGGLIAAPLDGADYGTPGFFVGQMARGLVMWGFILFLLGLFYPLRQTETPLLRYTSEMVLPFYILHQPVILILGYFLVLPLSFATLIKYALLVITSLLTVVAVYEFLVRRSNLLRILLGLKPLPHAGRQVGKKGGARLQL